MKKFIAVAGNIGVGKSTLVAMLCKQLKWEPFYEAVGDNPYLADFYADMASWSLPFTNLFPDPAPAFAPSTRTASDIRCPGSKRV